MDSTYGIAYSNIPFNKEDSIIKIRKNYIWKMDTYENFNINDYFEDTQMFCGTNLGSNIFGVAYKVRKNDILRIITAKQEWFKDFDKSLLTEEYYYFIWEDWG